MPNDRHRFHCNVVLLLSCSTFCYGFFRLSERTTLEYIAMQNRYRLFFLLSFLSFDHVPFLLHSLSAQIHYNCVFLVFHVSFINFELSSTYWNKRLLLQLFQYSYCSQCHMCYVFALCTYLFFVSLFFSYFFFSSSLCFIGYRPNKYYKDFHWADKFSEFKFFFVQRAEKTHSKQIF